MCYTYMLYIYIYIYIQTYTKLKPIIYQLPIKCYTMVLVTMFSLVIYFNYIYIYYNYIYIPMYICVIYIYIYKPIKKLKPIIYQLPIKCYTMVLVTMFSLVIYFNYIYIYIYYNYIYTNVYMCYIYIYIHIYIYQLKPIIYQLPIKCYTMVLVTMFSLVSLLMVIIILSSTIPLCEFNN